MHEQRVLTEQRPVVPSQAFQRHARQTTPNPRGCHVYGDQNKHGYGGEDPMMNPKPPVSKMKFHVLREPPRPAEGKDERDGIEGELHAPA